MMSELAHNSMHFSALPGIVISGNLPQLSVHINEDKVSTLKRMSTMLKRDFDTWSAPTNALVSLPLATSPVTCDIDEDDGDLFSALEGDVDESSKLFYLYFCIADLSLELQSRGKSLAQFKVRAKNINQNQAPIKLFHSIIDQIISH